MKVAVFCGSSLGHDPRYGLLAQELGERLAGMGMGLVYGGASIGVMAAIANSFLQHGQEVVGVIPTALMALEVGHKSLTRLEVVPDMHVRKARMYALSDHFIVLPGGMGTLDEMCEVLTWAQLRYHHKRLIIFNCHGFYDHFIAHLETLFREGFMKEEHRELFFVEASVEGICRRLQTLSSGSC